MFVSLRLINGKYCLHYILKHTTYSISMNYKHKYFVYFIVGTILRYFWILGYLGKLRFVYNMINDKTM